MCFPYPEHKGAGPYSITITMSWHQPYLTYASVLIIFDWPDYDHLAAYAWPNIVILSTQGETYGLNLD